MSPRLASLRRTVVVVTAVVLLALAAAVLLAAAADPGLLLGAVVAAAASAAWGWRAAGRTARAWGYTERADDLLLRRGVVVRRLVVVPYGRMQYVDVTAGPLARAFGIATVQLYTASASTDARIPGLEPAEAARLRDRLAALGEAQAAGL